MAAKPLSQQSTTEKVVRGVIAAAVLLGVITFFTDKKSSGDSGGKEQASATAAGGTSTWDYSESVDKMRGTVTKRASIQSTNKLDFKFPYAGGSTGELIVRKEGKEWSALLKVDKGQFTHEARLAFKFDNGPILDTLDTRGGYAFPAGGATNTLFIFNCVECRGNAKLLANMLTKAKHVTVEATYFQEGRRQLEFDVTGLDMAKLQ